MLRPISRPTFNRGPLRVKAPRSLRSAKVTLAGVAFVMLAGCGLVDRLTSDDNREEPSPLVEIESPLSVKELWNHDVGAGTKKQYLRLTPAVSEGRLFSASLGGDVVALDVQSGEELWSVDTDVSITGGPGAGEGLVLAGSNDGEVIALDAASGEQRWRGQVSSEILAAPRIAEGVVVVRSIDGNVFGLNAEDGKRRWLFDRAVPVLTLRGTSAPALAAGLAIVGFDNGQVVALELSSGKLVWELRAAVPKGRSELDRLVDIDAEPLVTRDALYVVSYQGRVLAADLASGDTLWHRAMSSHTGLAADEDLLIVIDENSVVWALDRYTSSTLWRQEQLRARDLGPPAIVGNHVVVGDFDGYVHWLRREDGALVARHEVGGDGITARPLAVAGTVFVYANDGTLAALVLGSEDTN